MSIESAYMRGWLRGYDRGATDTPKPIGPVDFDDHGDMAREEIKPLEGSSKEILSTARAILSQRDQPALAYRQRLAKSLELVGEQNEELVRALDEQKRITLAQIDAHAETRDKLASLKAQPSENYFGEFSKGDTDKTGDCDKFEAGIHHLTVDAGDMVFDGKIVSTDSKPETWFQRIVVYGSTAEQAEALRDFVIARLNSSPVSAGGVDERAAFEARFARTLNLQKRDDGRYVNSVAGSMLEAWQARAALNAGSAVPDGWRLVPVDATTEMVEALKARISCTSRGGILNAGNALNAAIAAAPTAKKEG